MSFSEKAPLLKLTPRRQSSTLSNSNQTANVTFLDAWKRTLSNNDDLKVFDAGTLWTITKTFAGAGTFALPWALSQSGIWAGIIGIIFIAVLSNFTIKVLIQCAAQCPPEQLGLASAVIINKEDSESRSINADLQILQSAEHRKASYIHIARCAFGEYGANFVLFLQVLVTLGVCICYLVFIAENLYALQPSSTSLSQVQCIWIAAIPALLLTFLPDLKYLSFTSALGVFALLTACGVVAWYGFSENLVLPLSALPSFDWSSFPLFVSSVSALFGVHISLLFYENKSSNRRQYIRTMDVSFIAVLIMNLIFAVLGFLFFGGGVLDNVMNNISTSSTAGNIALQITRAGLAFELICSYPVVMNLPVDVLSKLFHIAPSATLSTSSSKIIAFGKHVSGSEDSIWRPIFLQSRLALLKASLVAITALVAASVNIFGLLFSLVGAVGCSFTCFIFPSAFFLRLFADKCTRNEKILHYSILTFGVITFFVSGYFSLHGIIKALS